MADFQVPDDLGALLAGDRVTWAAFTDAYLSNVYSVAIQVLRNHTAQAQEADVNEIVSNVFHRLVKDDYHLLRGYDPEKSPLHIWIGMVTRSTAINWLNLKRLPTVPIEASVGNLEHEESNDGPEPIRIPEDLLSPRQELVLRLLFDKEMSNQEAAEFLGVNEQAVRMAKSRAIAKLREFYESEKKNE